MDLTIENLYTLLPDDDEGLAILGCDVIGDDVVTVPTVGANYTDAKTVTAVQFALVKKGYDLGTSGPNNDGVDGLFGSKTKSAIKKMQADANMYQSGKIDEGVIMALKVTPGVLPPGVTMAGRAAVQAQAALEAATAAEHAATPSDVQAAAQKAVDAAPAQPPELKQAAQAALVKAKAAKTPADVVNAAAAVKSAAQDVHSAVKVPWYLMPAWQGGPPTWQVGVAGAVGVIGLGLLGWGIFGGGYKPGVTPRGWKHGTGWKTEGHRLRHEAAYASWRDAENTKIAKRIAAARMK
jgi:peptidoglycan hydrolase-like protein with peptidoglycan-binding domain